MEILAIHWYQVHGMFDDTYVSFIVGVGVNAGVVVVCGVVVVTHYALFILNLYYIQFYRFYVQI